MIEVAQEVITEYMTDSVNKEIIISPTAGSLEDVNYYTGDVSGNSMFNVSAGETSMSGWFIKPDWMDTSINRFDNYVQWNYLQDHDYIVCAFNYRVAGTATVTTGTWAIVWEDTDGNAHITNIKDDNWLGYYNEPSQVILSMAIPNNMAFMRGISYTFTSQTTITDLEVWEGQLQVNFTDTADYVPNYKLPPDFSEFAPASYREWTVDNDSLIYEEFALTESLCSQDNIKFGLCEAAHCEFSEVGADVRVGDEIAVYSTLPNYINEITDDDIFKINWIGYDGNPATSVADASGWKPLLIHNSAFSPKWGDYTDKLGLASKYLYYQLNLKFTFANMSVENPVYFKFRYYALCDSTEYIFTSSAYYSVADYTDAYAILGAKDSITRSGYGVMSTITYFGVQFYDANKNVYTSGQNTGDIKIYGDDIQFRIGDAGHTMPAYSQADLYVVNGTLDKYLSQWAAQKIPLGIYQIASVSNEYSHNLIKKKITAYDKLSTLEANAADWCTSYMYGIDTDGYVSNGFEYARQIYSTYWNYITTIGLDGINNYSLNLVDAYDDADFIANQNSNYKNIQWTHNGTTYYLCYAMKQVTITDTSLLYRVTWENYNGETFIQRIAHWDYYFDYIDTLYRGISDNGGVLIEEYKTGAATPYNCFCVNNGDFFMLSDETAFIRFLLPSGNKSSNVSYCVNVRLQTAEPRESLVNGNLRLCYYNYSTKDIFACESSITGRDVVRSLLEVCGCFFRMSRYGLPEFVYPTKGGLYPSNTLYPADDLYPREGANLVSAMNKYMSVMAEDYEVTDYGRIQILKNVKSSSTVSVCEWQYEGDADKKNTYIIDDNIFYCADEMLYDYGGMPEVSDMLEGMWNVISNLGYVPNVTQALGAPWIECGDRVALLTFNGGFESFVFRRTLKGIQNLRDTYESAGDEYVPAINNFGY